MLFELIPNAALLLDLIQNIALIVTLAVAVQLFEHRFPGRALWNQVAMGVLFGVVGLIGMLTPVHFSEGIIYDGRSIILALAGLFGGGLPACIAAVLCGAYRLHLGGAGALVGTAVIVEAALLGMGLRHLRARDEKWMRPLPLLFLGFLVHAVMLALQLLLPEGIGWTIARQFGLAILVFYPAAFFVAAQVFIEGERHLKSVAALRDSESRFRVLADDLPTLISEWLPDGTLTFVNHACCEYLGMEREELLGRRFLEFLPEQAREAAKANYLQLTPEKPTVTHTHEVVRGGELRWHEWYNRAVFDDAGNAVKYRGAGVDITERMQLEQSLKRTQFSVDRAPFSIFWISASGRFVYVNEKAAQSLGYTREELLKLGVADVDPNFPAEKRAAHWARYRAEGDRPFETLHQRKDGSLFPVRVHGYFVEFEGEAMEVAEVEDITERKETERQNRLFAEVIQRSQDFVGVSDIERNALYVNPAGQAMVGLEGDEAVRATRIEDYFFPEDLPFLQGTIVPQLEREGRWSGEFRFRHFRTGEPIHVLYDLFHTQDPETGEITNYTTVTRDITERKRAEQALQESEQRFRSLFEHAAQGIGYYDLDGRVLAFNSLAAERLGGEPDEFIGKTLEELFGAKRGGEYLARIRSVADGCCTADYVQRVELPCGSRWFHSSYAPMTDAEGRVAGVQILSTDITEQWETEVALRRSDALYRSLAQNFPNGALFIFDQDYRYVSADGQGLAQAGLASEMIVGHTVEEVFPELWDTIRPHCDAALSGGRGYYEVEFAGRSYANQALPVYRESPEDCVALVVTQDITEKKRAEQALVRERQRLADILRGTNSGTWEWNIQTGETVFNDRWAEIVGYTVEELSPTTVDTWMRLAHPGDLEESNRLLEAHFKGESEYYDCEARMRHKDGSWVWVHDRGRVSEWDAEGNPVFMAGTHLDISERKRFERALKESETKYRTLFENMMHEVHLWKLVRDEHGAIETWQLVDANPAALQSWNKERSEVLNKTANEIFSYDATAQFMPIVERIFAAGEPYTWEEFVPATEQFLHMISVPFGEYFISTGIDITERKRAEEAVSESNRRFVTAFRHSPAPLVLSEIDTGLFIDVNDRWVEMLKFTREEQVGRTSKEVGIWDDPGERDRIVAKLRSYGRFRDEPIRFRTKSGKTILALWSAETVELSGKQAMLSMITDITQLRQAEEGLLRQQRSLDLFNQIAAAFLTFPRGDVFADVLDIVLRTLDSRFGYFGYIDEAGDLVCPSMTRDIWEECGVADKSITFPRSCWGGLWGRSLLEKRTLVANEGLSPPEGHMTLENALAVPIVHQNILIGQFVVANKAEGYDQEDRELLEAAATYTAPILFAIQEEARQKSAHEKLEAQLRQAQKMESVGRLAGGVAHDFNNMLNVILGYADILLDDVPADSAWRADLEEIQGAARRSAELTRQLLAFARKQTIAPEVLDLNETVEALLRMLGRLIGEDIDLLWQPASSLPSVRMDPAQVDQLLANLVVNARDAIGHHVGKVTIETGKTVFDEAYCREHVGFSPGEYVMLAVSDDGCGMDEETRAHVFEPFFTTKDVGEGTGLGLATVYGIVRQNQGFVNVYSELGQGTTFRVYFPVCERHAMGEQGAADAETPGAKGQETILVVEDEPAILAMATRMLERYGYEVLSASTPGEAIDLAAQHNGPIHLLITDVVMPEMNGRDLARNLIAMYPNLRRLFMSGYTANVIAHQGVLDKGVNFLQKPFSQKALGIKVREALDSGK